MNDLETYVAQNAGRIVTKMSNYFEIYERHFARFRGTDVHVVEVGVRHGGSLRLWKHYFGPSANIVGVDINPHCKALEEERVAVFIGDQADRTFLRELAARLPRIDILIDDGGHMMAQQIHTFEELFPYITPNGIYLCEDLHTSYMPWAGGWYRRRGTFVEYSKTLIDQLNAWHVDSQSQPRVNDFTRSAHSLHYYDSVLVIEKRPMSEPWVVGTGTLEIPDFQSPRTLRSRAKAWMQRHHVR